MKYIHWVTLREVKQQYVSPGGWRQIQPYYWYFPEVNDRLEMALDRHPNLYLVDFAAVADSRTSPTTRSTSTRPAPRLQLDRPRVGRERADRVARRVRHPGADPRPRRRGRRGTQPHHRRAPRAGFLTVFPCDTPLPTLSNHNYGRADRGELGGDAVGATGEVCVYTHRGTQVIVDITGRFGAGSGIVPGAPDRVLDTRLAGGPLAAGVERQLPLFTAASGAAALSVTAVGAGGPGFVRVAPCGSTGTTSTVNVAAAAAVPNLTIVEGSPAAPLCVTASRPMDVLVDVFVPFADANGVDVAAPERVRDTCGRRICATGAGHRRRDRRCGPRCHGDHDRRDAQPHAADARSLGFLTVYPCAAGRPDTSSLNYVPGEVVANFVIVQPDAAGKVCVFTYGRTHVIVDVLGTTADGFAGSARSGCWTPWRPTA